MRENKIENMAWIIFAIVGVAFFISGLFILGNIFNYENKIDTIGTITEISSYRDTNRNIRHKVYVLYTIEGKEYESNLNGYSSDFYEGKEIDIYYDKDDPNKIGVKSLDLGFLLFPVLGLISLMIGGTGILVKVRNRKLEKDLKKDGELIYANYLETVLNTVYSVNGRRPYNIICKWNDPLDNKEYIFKSKNIWINAERIIEEKNIKKFPIYVSKNNKKKYVIDIDVLTQNTEKFNETCQEISLQKENKGITLVALVITIIVLLILAGVTI